MHRYSPWFNNSFYRGSRQKADKIAEQGILKGVDLIPPFDPYIPEPLNIALPDLTYMKGTWEIIDCGLETAKGDSRGVLGTVFELTAAGEVIWTLPEYPIDIPLFSTDIYEVVTRGPYLTSLLRFGSYKGHVIEFRIEKFDFDSNTVLAHDGLFYMTCKKLRIVEDHVIELPYTLLPALEEGYFSDLSIFASNKNEFRVHTCILKLTAPELDWTADPTPLSGLPQDILAAILHFMYSQSLPKDITENRIEEIIAVVSNYPGFELLVSNCHTFIRNSELKQVLLTLISDVHKCGMRIMESFSCIYSTPPMISDPDLICTAVNNSIKEVAMAAAKILLFCDLYNKRKSEFSTDVLHEIIRFTKTRIPVLVSQMEAFFHALRETVTTLQAPQRSSLAHFLLPEMENIFDILLKLSVKARAFLEGVLNHYGPVDEERFRVLMSSLKIHMDRAHKRKEVARIQFFLQKLDCISAHLHKKRESFRSMTNANQVRFLGRNLDRLFEKVPFFLMRLEEIAADLDDRLDWSESIFCFKMATAKVAELLKTLHENKDSFGELLKGMSELIQQEEFTQTAVALELLDSTEETSQPCDFSKQHGFENEQTFSLTDFLLTVPVPRKNALCKAATESLKKAEDTDMIFQIMSPEYEDSDSEETGVSEDETAEGEGAAAAIEGAAAAVEGAAAALEEGAAAAVEEGAAAAVEGAAAAVEEGAAAALDEGAAAALEGAAAALEEGTDIIGKRKLRKELDYTKIKILRETVATVAADDSSASVTPETEEPTEKKSDEPVEEKQEIDFVKFKAHRVIVATRCDWFRRALLSGMQEDINRQIDIHCLPPSLFSKFLDFLYSGVLDLSSLTGTQLSRLILLADCYEMDEFKLACEKALKIYINDDSVLALLSLADNYNANWLKGSCLTYITNHPDVTMDCSFFDELPPHLRIQIYDMVIWGKHVEMIEENSANASRRLRRATEVTVELDSDDNEEADGGEASRPEPESSQDISPLEESKLLESLIDEVHEIVGSGAPRSLVVQVILAAEHDLNRALNYYYSSS